MPLKVRKNKAPPPPPSCPLTECMSLLGSAWTPNVVWHLSAGARRFMELRADMPAISAKVLSTRLRELERKGVVARRVMPTSPPSVEYTLTDLGRQLMPAIVAIVEVGHKLKSSRAAKATRAPRPQRETRRAATLA
jgi:DNA-binding HxlR family transcriptional regulator